MSTHDLVRGTNRTRSLIIDWFMHYGVVEGHLKGTVQENRASLNRLLEALEMEPYLTRYRVACFTFEHELVATLWIETTSVEEAEGIARDNIFFSNEKPLKVTADAPSLSGDPLGHIQYYMMREFTVDTRTLFDSIYSSMYFETEVDE